MKQELVERVMREMDSIDTRACNDGSPPYHALAHYALALAERAAREALLPSTRALGVRDSDIVARAVERAVEGGA